LILAATWTPGEGRHWHSKTEDGDANYDPGRYHQGEKSESDKSNKSSHLYGERKSRGRSVECNGARAKADLPESLPSQTHRIQACGAHPARRSKVSHR